MQGGCSVTLLLSRFANRVDEVELSAVKLLLSFTIYEKTVSFG